jgi:hypothetical protein
MPVRHGSGFVVHARPAVQAEHTPPLQTRSVPQTVPSGSGTAALSRQTDVPVEHDVMPVRQRSGFVVQVAPAMQPTQLPPLHT